MKKILLWVCMILIAIPPLSYTPTKTEAASSNIQTLKVPVVSNSVEANPYVAYWEEDAGNFRVKNDLTGEKYVSSSGGLPVVTDVAQRLKVDDYPAQYYYIESLGDNGVKFPHASVSDKHITKIELGKNATDVYSEPPEHKTLIAWSRTGGNDLQKSCEVYNASRGKLLCEYPYTFTLHYEGNVQTTKRITAKSDATLKIGQTTNVTATIATKEGANGTFGAEVDVTQRIEETKWSSDKSAVASVSSNGKVTANSKGTAKICATWTKEDEVYGTWDIADCVTITVTDEEIPPPVTPPVDADCAVTISEPSVAENMQSDSQDMLADPIGSITEDKTVATSAVFDVLQYGIASDEYLQLWGETERYLSEFEYLKKVGTVTYTIPVDKTYNRSWKMPYDYECGTEENPETCTGYTSHSDSVVVNTTKEDVHDYGYWEIGNLVIYELQDLTFENYALPNGKTIVQNNRHYIVVDAKHSKSVYDHVFPKACTPYTLPTASIGTPIGGPPPVPMGEFESEAQAKVLSTRDSRIPDVKNDYIKITVTSDGNTISDEVFMDDALVPSEGPTPTKIPKSDRVELEKDKNYIAAEKVNKWATESAITANYKLKTSINKTPEPQLAFKNTSYDGKINTVTVHTPVTMYAKASDDKAHDQRTNPPIRQDLSYTDGGLTVQSANPDTERHAFILDRPFTVVLPTHGQHLDESMSPGYGNRDFSKYYKDKQVRFPFDVYTESKAGYYPANTWISIPVNNESATFFMPVWVPEGKYTIEYRGITINAPNTHIDENKPTEHHANLNQAFRIENEMMDNHIAYDTLEVDVVGRLYDLRITDVLDYEWQDVFRNTRNGLLQHTGNFYWVGKNSIDGVPRGNKEPMILPIRNGSHALSYPNEKLNVAIKTGYQFRFDLKTKGNMFNSQDAIRIKPSFYFVDKRGNREPVDLYYHDDNNYFVKIGSDADKTYREVILNDLLRNVTSKQLLANSDYIYRHIDNYRGDYREAYDEVGGIEESFHKRYFNDLSKRPIQTGTYGFQILTQPLNTFIGPEETEVPNCSGAANCTMVPAEDIVAREQQWFGEYSLPANVYVVEKQEPVYDANGVEIPQVDMIAGYGREHRLNDNSLIFKKDGYIVVNFNIETLVGGNTTQSHLTYHTSPYKKAPLNNQWKMEGFVYEVVDGYGVRHQLKDGDMVYYHADRSSYDDFNSNVTH